ncbi:MAG: COG1470 family protein [Candidatus Hodarchaeales archaeon]
MEVIKIKRSIEKYQFEKIILSSIIFLILFTFKISPCVAVNIWSDDFEDGNYDEWTVLDGSFLASSTKLMASGEMTDPHRIRHDSNISYGTWSFDVLINMSSYIYGESMYIYFLMESLESLGDEIGYYLRLIADPSWMVWPTSFTFGSRTAISTKSLGESSYAGKLAQKQHIDITRSIDGHFNVFVDETLIIEAMDNEYTTSNYFGFHTQAGHGLDNITVDNEIKIWPKATDQAKLQFTVESMSKTVEKGSTETITVVVKNEGRATGYGTLVIGTPPSGITVELFGSDQIKNMKSNNTKDIPLKINTEASVRPGTYNVSLEIKNSSDILDTLILEIKVPENGTGVPGFEIWSITLILCLLVKTQRKKRAPILIKE